MNGGPDDILGINILTNDLFVVVSTYLPKTSRALLAVALTAPSSSWRKCQWKGEPTAASKAIILSVANQQLPTTKSMIDALTSNSNFYGNGQKLRTFHRANAERIKFVKKEIEAQ